MTKHIPNAITLGNLLCGLLALLSIWNNNINLSIVFIFLGAFLDFFDGLAARLLKVDGELGKQLDSLADMVTFGVAPGFLMLHIASYLGYFSINSYSPLNLLTGFACFSITLFSGYRLAKFNIDTRQQFGFIGLPTPANTLLICSLVWIIINQDIHSFFTSRWFIIIFGFTSAFMLNAPLPLFALKFKSFAWKGNEWRISFILITIILIATLQIPGIPIAIILYLLMSLVKNLLKK